MTRSPKAPVGHRASPGASEDALASVEDARARQLSGEEKTPSEAAVTSAIGRVRRSGPEDEI